MKASEAAKLAEEASVRASHEYSTVIKIIKAHASNGHRTISLPISTVSKLAKKILEDDGYEIKYVERDVHIKW